MDEKIETPINTCIQDVLKLSKNDKIIIFCNAAFFRMDGKSACRIAICFDTSLVYARASNERRCLSSKEDEATATLNALRKPKEMQVWK